MRLAAALCLLVACHRGDPIEFGSTDALLTVQQDPFRWYVVSADGIAVEQAGPVLFVDGFGEEDEVTAVSEWESGDGALALRLATASGAEAEARFAWTHARRLEVEVQVSLWARPGRVGVEEGRAPAQEREGAPLVNSRTDAGLVGSPCGRATSSRR